MFFINGLLELYYISIQVIVISGTLYVLISKQNQYFILVVFTVCLFLTIFIICIALNLVVYFTNTWWRIQRSNKINRQVLIKGFVFSVKRFFGNVTEEFSLTIMWSTIVIAIIDILLVFSSLFVLIIEEYSPNLKMHTFMYNCFVKAVGKDMADIITPKAKITDGIDRLVNVFNKELNVDFNLYDYCLLLCLMLFGLHVFPILLYRLCSWGVFSKNIQERVKKKYGLPFRSNILKEMSNLKKLRLTPQTQI